MATRRKNTNKIVTKEETLPKGISLCPDGRYMARSGSGPSRRQYKFDTSTEAVAWKTMSDQSWDEHGRSISKEDWLRSGAQSGRRPAESLFTPIVLAVFLVEAVEAVAVSQVDGSSTRSAGKVLERYFKYKKVLRKEVHMISGGVAFDFPEWLHDQNYSKEYQGAVLGLAQRVWTRGIAFEHTSRNPFKGLKISGKALTELDRDRNVRPDYKAPAWTAEQLVAIASLLREVYRVVFWLFVLTGLRRSEVFGLVVGDWNSESRDLFVRFQRRGSPAKGRRDVKSKASRRPIPVCRTLALLIDKYIQTAHPRPSDEAGMAAWRQRYLFTGVHGRAMNAQTFCDQVKGACLLLGLDPTLVGSYSPLHQLRASFGARLGSLAAGLTGRVISLILGHKVAAAVGPNPAARVTRTFYMPEVVGELEELVVRIETWVQEDLLPLCDGDLGDIGDIDDGISIVEAARWLSMADAVCSTGDVEQFIQQGALRTAQSNHCGQLGNRVVLVSADEVRRLAAQLTRDGADTYSATEVGEIFGLDRQRIYQMAQEGSITETTDNATNRVGARGFRTGSMPGGGRRFDKAGVDELAESEVDDIDRRKNWLTLKEAASLLQESVDTVRRRADRDELRSWRDPRTTHQRRLVDREAVRGLLAARAVLTVEDGAALLGTSAAEVRALVKLGVLTSGPRRGTVLERTVKDEINRRRADDDRLGAVEAVA